MASATMVRGRTGLEGERTRAEGRLRTVCVREEREYLSLSSWRWRGGEGMKRRRRRETDFGSVRQPEMNDELIKTEVFGIKLPSFQNMQHKFVLKKGILLKCIVLTCYF